MELKEYKKIIKKGDVIRVTDTYFNEIIEGIVEDFDDKLFFMNDYENRCYTVRDFDDKDIINIDILNK